MAFFGNELFSTELRFARERNDFQVTACVFGSVWDTLVLCSAMRIV